MAAEEMVTVKQIVEGIIAEFENKAEIEVQYIVEMNEEKIDRSDIVKAFQQMEEEGVGTFMKGRRGKPSRFVKGMTRAKNPINKEALDALREEIQKLNHGDAMLASLIDCEEKAETEEQLCELEEFKGKSHAAQFFDDNTAKAVDALKILQKEGLGSFIIGRRGKFSRFIKGVSKDELQSRPKGLVPKEESIIEERDPKYEVVRNIILRTFDEGKFDNLHDAMIEADVDDLEKVKDSIQRLGYFYSK
jgi:hypothetical protein